MLVSIKNKKSFDLEKMFVHRSGFLSLCDFAYTDYKGNSDQWFPDNVGIKTPFAPESVPQNSVIFCTPWGITAFLKDIHPRIQNKYILLTHCYGPVSDVSKYINDPKIIHWFGQANIDAVLFDKFTLIPLGVLSTNEIFDRSDFYMGFFEKLRNIPKTKLLYSNYMVHQGQHVEQAGRDKIYNMFKDKEYCTTITLRPDWRMPFPDYMVQLAEHKFVLSPEGDMIDTYRHYEALLAGSIPILRTSVLDKIFENLPVVIVNDYSEVNENFLNQKYEEIKNKKYNLNKLYIKYWNDLINTYKK